MSEDKFQQDGTLPSYISKDQVAFQLLYQAIKQQGSRADEDRAKTEKRMDELNTMLQKQLSDHLGIQTQNGKDQQAKYDSLLLEINAIKLQNASMASIHPDDVRESISGMKSSKSGSKLLLPIFILMGLSLSLIGLKDGVNSSRDAPIPIKSPIGQSTHMIMPDDSWLMSLKDQGDQGDQINRG